MSKLVIYFKNRYPVTILSQNSEIVAMRDELIDALSHKQEVVSFDCTINLKDVTKYKYVA